MMKTERWIFIAGGMLVLALGACGGPDAQFRRAQELEEKAYYVEAGMKYEGIARKDPQSPLAPEALYRAGRIYQDKLKLYSRAGTYYNRIIEHYPASGPWPGRAKLALLNSPDYFPLSAGSSWVEGDSETHGRNMRAQWDCTEVSSGTFSIRRRVFAGSRFVSESRRFYRKQDFEVREYQEMKNPRAVILFSYPFYEGKSWRSVRDGQALTYAVAARGVSLKVKAGEFTNCLKVSEANPLMPGSVKYNYYAPGVGWVLTTISAGGREHTNTELLSYKIVPGE
ncbi:MAG: tetratricopeptide repeat protein [Endomicrobiales bacterium]